MADGMVTNGGSGIATVQGRVARGGACGSSCGPAANGPTVPAVSAGITAAAFGGAKARAAPAPALRWRNGGSRTGALPPPQFRHRRDWMPDDATIVALRSEAAEAPTAKREAPQKQPERPAAVLSVPGKPARSSRRPLGRGALFGLLPLALSSAVIGTSPAAR